MIYLDHNATTRPTPEVVQAMTRMLTEHWANPASAHRAGQGARREVELARASVAKLIGSAPGEIVFTGTATESIDLAIRGGLRAMRPPGEGAPTPLVVSTPVEHEAVRMLCEDLQRRAEAEVRTLGVDRLGRTNPAELDQALADAAAARRPTIVSIQWANNETGVVQPIGPLSEVCRRRGAVLHSDATQWIGKHPVDLDGPPEAGGMIDLLTLAGHKFHGPKGIGALYIRKGRRIEATIRGVQELERRGGTENAPGIVGLGVAADQARTWVSEPANIARLTELRDDLERRLVEAIDGAIVHGAGEGAGGAGPEPGRLCNTISLSIPGAEAEALVLALSERGVCVSAGAACASGSMEPSPVLRAMGVDEEHAAGTIRLSLSRFTTPEEVQAALPAITEVARALRATR